LWPIDTGQVYCDWERWVDPPETVVSMNVYELRDSDEARLFLLQGLWWQRVLTPRPDRVREALEWAMEIASAGHPLPPLGFLADLGHVAFGLDVDPPVSREALPVPSLPIHLLRTYEDHVLGKFYADWSFGRASDALRRYRGRDRARGLAFLVQQFGERAHFAGVSLSPGVIKTALDSQPEDLHNEGWGSLSQDGVMPELIALYEGLVAAARRCAEVLGQEDVSQLERGTALKPEGERLAERQVLQAAAQLEAMLPRHRLRPLPRRMEVPTRILDEDTYPVGGFTSISTRGSVESLLHSQLAYMETDERPDLFDIKFLRDELLYYARDENQFLRRRRTFVFVLYPDLDQTRFKDRGLDYQRGVLMLALLYVAVRKLSDWLSTDALSFRFRFVVDGNHDPLAAERALLESLFIDQIANETVHIEKVAAERVGPQCTQWARRSLCHCLLLDVAPRQIEATDTVVTRLQIDGPRPALGDALGEPAVPDCDTPLESWGMVLQGLLQRWLG
jgi:hypothetical protein